MFQRCGCHSDPSYANNSAGTFQHYYLIFVYALLDLTLTKALYDSFYEKLPSTQLKAEIERCHQELIEKLEKPERKLVLQIIDCKDQIAENLSIDSFTAGFRLAMRLSQELNMYEKGHPLSTSDFVE